MSKTCKSVVVIGMHRSGTSLIAGILRILGVDMGKNMMPAHWSNPLGHFENMEFVKLNDQILRSAGGSWDNPPSEKDILDQKNKFSAIIKELIKKESSEIWGWKDPRTSLTIELYLPYLENPCFVICHRDPLSIARSLNQRDKKDIETGLKLTQIYEDRISNFLRKYPNLKAFHVKYEKLVLEPENVLKKLVDFLGISVGNRFSEAVRFVRPKGKVWGLDIRADGYVSIIIPVYNRIEYTERCLSVLYQVTPAGLFEVIIVDNGSSDKTAEFLNEFSKDHLNLKVIRNSKNLGFAKACNQGARAAKGDYLVFLNNDTVPLEGWLQEMIKVLKQNKNVGIVGSKLLFPDNTLQHAGVVICDFPYPISPYHIFYKKPANIPEANEIREYQAVTGACMLIPKKIFEEAAGFDEEFVNGYEDIDLCFKVKSLGYRILYCPFSRLYHFEVKTEGRYEFEEDNLKRLNQKWKDKIKPDIKTESISIVIVTHNSSKEISTCLNSILSFTSLPYEVIVVDNGSTDNTKEILNAFKKRFSLIRLIFNDQNLGFAKACNQGIRYANGKYIVLLNPDTAVTPNWDKRMITHFKKDVGAVGPVSNYAAGKQGLGFYLKDLDISAGSFDISYISEMLYRHNKGKGIDTKLLIGFCIMVKKEVFNKVGMLDENLFLGNDDLEFSWRLRLNGYRLIIASDVFIYHKGQASFKSKPSEQIQKLVQESTDRLADKLIRYYGFGNVPFPEELWGIDWFKPSERYKNMFKKIDKKVSVVILNYRKPEDTIECLESVYKSSYERFQAIVVDNNSQDGSVEKILRWAKENGIKVNKENGFRKELILILNDKNVGFAAANNIGIRYALNCGAEYVWILNNDTVVEKDALIELLKASFIDKRIGLVSSKIYLYENKDLVQYDGSIPSDTGKKDKKDDSLRFVKFAPACSLLVKREVIEDIGFFDEDYFLYFEDNDFCKRAKNAGWNILYNPGSKIYHKGSVSIGKWLKTPVSAYYAPRNFLYCNAQDGIVECFRFLENNYWPQLSKKPDCIKGFVEGVKDFIVGKKGKVDPEHLNPNNWKDWPDKRIRDAAKELVSNPDKWTFLKFLSVCQASVLKTQTINKISNREKAKSLCLEGERLFKNGEIDRAISLFEEAIETDPLYPDSYNDIAVAFWHKGDRENALYYISQALRLSPDNLDAIWNCAQIVSGLGFIDEAQKLYKSYEILSSIQFQKQQQESLLKENYPPETEKLILFFTPGYDVVNGGILSISSIYEETRKLKNIHGAEVIMCTIPGDPVLLRYTKFRNSNYIYKFSQVLSYFQNLKEIMIHIPLHAIRHITDELFNRYQYELKRINKVHFNIMLQNIKALPEDYKQIFQKLKQMGKLTCTTAHKQYSTLQMRKKLGIPLHWLSTYVSPEWYKKRAYKEKQDLMIVSPDPHPEKKKILDMIQRNFPFLKIQIIENMSYEDYKELISKAKWALTFGEGLDGYFVETVFSGGISFAVYNPYFFTDDFKSLQTVYNSYAELEKRICIDIGKLDNEKEFLRYQLEQFNICKAHYSYDRYLKNLRLFYENKYTFK